MLLIAVSTLINRPVHEVWDFCIDLSNSSHWTASGSELRQTSAGPPGVGMTIESVRPLFGRQITSQRIEILVARGQRASGGATLIAAAASKPGWWRDGPAPTSPTLTLR